MYLFHTYQPTCYRHICNQFKLYVTHIRYISYTSRILNTSTLQQINEYEYNYDNANANEHGTNVSTHSNIIQDTRLQHNIIDTDSLQKQYNNELLCCTAATQLIDHYKQYHANYNNINYVTLHLQYSKLVKTDTINVTVYHEICQSILPLIRNDTTLYSRGIINILYGTANTCVNYEPIDGIKRAVYDSCIDRLNAMVNDGVTLEKSQYIRCIAGITHYNSHRSTFDTNTEALIVHLYKHINAIRYVYTIDDLQNILSLSLRTYTKLIQLPLKQQLLYTIHDCIELLAAMDMKQLTAQDICELFRMTSQLNVLQQHKVNQLYDQLCIQLKLIVITEHDLPLINKMVRCIDKTHLKRFRDLCTRIEYLIMNSLSTQSNINTQSYGILKHCGYYPSYLVEYINHRYEHQYIPRSWLLIELMYDTFNAQTHVQLPYYNCVMNKLIYSVQLDKQLPDRLQYVYDIYIHGNIATDSTRAHIMSVFEQVSFIPAPHNSATSIAPSQQLIRSDSNTNANTRPPLDKRQLFLLTTAFTESQCSTYTGAQLIVLLHNIEEIDCINDPAVSQLYDVCYHELILKFTELNNNQLLYLIQYCQQCVMFTYEQFELLVQQLHFSITQYDMTTLCDIVYYTSHFKRYNSVLYNTLVQQIIDYVSHQDPSALDLCNDHINMLILGLATLQIKPVQLIKQLIHNTTAVLYGNNNTVLTSDQLNCLVSSAQQLLFHHRIYDSTFYTQLFDYMSQPHIQQNMTWKQLSVISECFAELNYNSHVYWEPLIARLFEADLNDIDINSMINLYCCLHYLQYPGIEHRTVIKYVKMGDMNDIDENNQIKLYKLALYCGRLNKLHPSIRNLYRTQLHAFTVDQRLMSIFQKLHSDIQYNVYDNKSRLWFQYYIDQINSDYLVDTEHTGNIVTDSDATPFVVTMTVQFHSIHTTKHYNINTDTYDEIIYQSDVILHKYYEQNTIYVCHVDVDYFNTLTGEQDRLMYIKQCLTRSISDNSAAAYQFGV